MSSMAQRMAYKQLAGALASLGLVVAAYVALAPISVEAPLADGRCGPPIVRVAAQEEVDDPNAQRIIDRCEDAAGERLALAGAALGAGLAGFVLARGVGRRRVHLARQRRRREADRAAAQVRADRARERADAGPPPRDQARA